MAQQALPAGAVRRRAVFGLFDADGWSWAGIKATFWFLVFVFLLGYIPNLAYYFTVSNTVQVGYSVLSPINWCPATNEDLPCPAPAGAVVPWQTSPTELNLPTAVAGGVVAQSGVHIYLVGGTTAAGVTADVQTTQVGEDGNLLPWVAGPALPEPRSNATVVMMTGVPYIIGGLDAAGQQTTSVFMGEIEDGELTGWTLQDGSPTTQALTLPTPLSDAAAVPASDGIYLFGGLTPDGLTATVLYSAIEDGPLTKWQPVSALPLPEARADATAVALGDTMYVFGGTGLAGPTNTIYRLQLDEGLPATTEEGKLIGWASAPTSQQLPFPRADAMSFSANGIDLCHRRRGPDGCSPGDYAVGRARHGHRRPAQVEPARPDGPAGGPRQCRSRGHRFVRLPACGHWADRSAGQHRASEPVPAAAVLPVGHPGCHHPGPLHQGRDRPATGLHQRDDRGHDQLRAAHPAGLRVLAPRRIAATPGEVESRSDQGTPG